MTPTPAEAKPWGRLTLVSKEETDDSDHIYFKKKITTIGRNKRRCDFVIDKLFISSVLDDADENGEPIVELHDNSRNGIWVNADRIGKGASTRLGSGYTVHFTKPGATPTGVSPMVYKFEFLNSHVPSSVYPTAEAIKGPNDIDMTVVTDEPIDATQLTSPLSQPEKKRKRMDEEPPILSVSTQEHDKRLAAAESLNEIVEKKATAEVIQGSNKEGLEHTVEAQVHKLREENLELVAKLETARAEIVQLQKDLAAKDNDIEVKIKEATAITSEEIMTLKKETLVKEKAMESKIKEVLMKSFEAEMTVKLKEATKKYQQKVEAEHYEERQEMSEKLAAFANENESLKLMSDAKDDELGECRDQITRLREKISVLKYRMSAQEKKLTESQKKVAQLEEQLAVSKDECEEMCGLLAAAEDKVTAAKNKVSIAADRADDNEDIDANRQLDLKKSIYSLRSELETFRAQLASQEEKHNHQQVIAAFEATITSHTDGKSIAPDTNAEVLRARLAAAFTLFSQVQALGLQGTSLITGSNSSEREDLDLPSATSEKMSHANGAAENSIEYFSSPGKLAANSVNGTAEPKELLSKLNQEKSKTNKEAAPVSPAIETDAASTVAAMASLKSSSTCSPSDACTTVAKSDIGDWEMLE